MNEKFLYFFIFYEDSGEEKENKNDIKFVVPENKELQPELIYEDKRYESSDLHYKLFRVNKSAGKGNNGHDYYYFEFIRNDLNYYIHFDYKGSSFIYDAVISIKQYIGCYYENIKFYKIL